jgi:hypothetical protein
MPVSKYLVIYSQRLLVILVIPRLRIFIFIFIQGQKQKQKPKKQDKRKRGRGRGRGARRGRISHPGSVVNKITFTFRSMPGLASTNRSVI